MKRIYLRLVSIIAATVCVFSFLSLPIFAQEGPGAPPSGEDRPDDPPDGQGGGPGGPGGADTMTYDYDGTLSGALTADGNEVSSSGETISTETIDENAALATNGGTLTISDGTLTKSGDDANGDSCNFYGVNSIALAVGEGSQMILSHMTLTADSTGSNGIFATDDATVLAKDVTINTTSDNSRGLDATYGGTILADRLDISTQGDHCASLATDRGGGQISVTNSTLNTAGSGSPLLYSTGDIEVFSTTGTASGSQIAGMEGLNTILIYDSALTSTNTTTTGSDPVANGIILYQSTSGDAEASTGETATFQAVRSTLSSAIESGAMFYITNTSVDILLEDTTLDFDSEAARLMQIEGNDANNWGKAGSNGATVTCTAIREALTGDISVDTISALDLYLTDSTVYTGAISIVDNAYGSSSEAPAVVHLDGTSTWIVTENSTISTLYAEAGSQILDADGQTVSIVSEDGTVLAEGSSSITLTVTDTYSEEASGTASTATDSFIDRSAFDTYFGVEETAEESSEELMEESAEESSTEEVSSKEESSMEEIESETAEEASSAEESSVLENSVPESATETVEKTAKNTALPWIIVGAAIVLVAGIALTVHQRKKR